MRSVAAVVAWLVALTCFRAGDDPKGPMQDTKPKLIVTPRYQVRKNFAAFEDVYPLRMRQEALKRFDETEGGVTAFRAYNLGTITVRSGKLAAFDPVVFMGGAFAKPVKNGEYPVLLAAQIQRGPALDGKNADPPHPFVVLARVELAERPAVRWELALFADEKLNEKNPKRLTGYGVDSGMGAFADADGFTAFKKAQNAAMHDEIQRRAQWFHGGRAGALSWAKVKYGTAEMMRFGSFGGDGQYASYWGYDKDGKVVALMTDFGWLDWVGKPAGKK